MQTCLFPIKYIKETNYFKFCLKKAKPWLYCKKHSKIENILTLHTVIERLKSGEPIMV